MSVSTHTFTLTPFTRRLSARLCSLAYSVSVCMCMCCACVCVCGGGGRCCMSPSILPKICRTDSQGNANETRTSVSLTSHAVKRAGGHSLEPIATCLLHCLLALNPDHSQVSLHEKTQQPFVPVRPHVKPKLVGKMVSPPKDTSCEWATQNARDYAFACACACALVCARSHLRGTACEHSC